MANVEDPRQAVLSASWVSASLILIKGTSIIPIFGWETEGKEKNHSARMNQHLKPGTPGPEATLSLMLVFTHTHTHKTRYSRSWAHTLTDVSIHTHTHTHTHTPVYPVTWWWWICSFSLFQAERGGKNSKSIWKLPAILRLHLLSNVSPCLFSSWHISQTDCFLVYLLTIPHH